MFVRVFCWLMKASTLETAAELPPKSGWEKHFFIIIIKMHVKMKQLNGTQNCNR
jgi:hypothetical protein